MYTYYYYCLFVYYDYLLIGDKFIEHTFLFKVLL